MSAERTVHEEPAPPSSSSKATERPPAHARSSGLRLKASESGFPIQEVLARFELGDFLGALAVAGELLDDGRVPTVIVSRDQLHAFRLEDREELIVSLIDGKTSLEVVLENTGLPMIDALRTLCELVEKRVVALR